MNKKTMIMIGVMILTVLAGCTFKTPEIRGVVLDNETKQPVAGAWIFAAVQVKVNRLPFKNYEFLVAGKTWTDQEGKFSISASEYEQPPFPFYLGVTQEELVIMTRTVSARGDFLLGEAILREPVKKADVTIFLKPPKDDNEYFNTINEIMIYISSGRIRQSTPAVPEIERKEIFDLAIDICNAYLNLHENHKYIGFYSKDYDAASYSNVLKSLARTYKRKGDYRKALETFIKSKEFDKRMGMRYGYAETEIMVLQQLLKER